MFVRRDLGRTVHLAADTKVEQLLDPDIELPDVHLVSKVLVHKMGVVSAMHWIVLGLEGSLARHRQVLGCRPSPDSPETSCPWALNHQSDT